MKWAARLAAALVLLLLLVPEGGPAARAASGSEDLVPRLQEIYRLRAEMLVSGQEDQLLAREYLSGSATARWALNHEKGKFRYMRQWTANRGVRIVEAEPRLEVKYLGGSAARARFYVAQSLMIGYVYPGEETVNRFGVGMRHIMELRRQDDRWLIALEWYTDPLGDDTETPDVSPAVIPDDSRFPARQTAAGWRKSYDREGAARYADMYCGVAWGCGNKHRYNPKYRDYNGVGGDCTNFVVQALRDGGGLSMPGFTRVEGLVGHLQWTGRGTVAFREPFAKLWQRAMDVENGFPGLFQIGDLVAYQEKGKMAHFAMITGFDTRGYPLVNSHTADRYHVPFDLGWDKETIYWMIKMH
jgi:hypothetical protein